MFAYIYIRSAAPEATDEPIVASPIGVGGAPRADATNRQVALTSSNEARGPGEAGRHKA